MNALYLWKAGTARAAVTPDKPLWLAGYGIRTRPAEGKRHDLWIKALALEDAIGRRAVLLTSDLLGFSKGMYDRLCAECLARFGLDRSRVLLTASHNHNGPVIADSLPDYYPLTPEQPALIAEYTLRLEGQILETIGEALGRMAPARLRAGEGETDFAGNRRNNAEADSERMRAEGIPLNGPSDYSVPVLLAENEAGKPLAVVFGYACHPTTLADYEWCGDYPGYAQVELEAAYPGAQAMFWTGCGGDQNPMPRQELRFCERYGLMLASAVKEALANPLRPVAPELLAAFEFVRLDFDRNPTPEEIREARLSENVIRRRWGRRMEEWLQSGQPFTTGHDYAVQVWRMGDRLWINLGAEAVVDYALRFKAAYGPDTWVGGYAHDMTAYIPSRRVWEEGGYESEYLWEYSLPADRWSPDTEGRIAAAVHRLAVEVSK
ncbi:MAG: hypothetical protein IT210_03625 [Armatimonadetes bacterium]|nr:hypothetical protein [Armatimonadota bacterium]